MYEIKNKYYIKVGGFYKEVSVTLGRDGLDVKPVGNKIEITNASEVKNVNVNEIREELIRHKENEKMTRSVKQEDNTRKYR